MVKKQDITRKRLLFRSQHRGQRELDILFAQFAAEVLPALAADELESYQALLDIADAQLLDWVLGRARAPKDASPMLRRFLQMAQARYSKPAP